MSKTEEGIEGQVVTDLLESACPSIRCRLRLELLGQSRSDPEVAGLQPEILEDAAVREVLGWRKPDGWLAWDFHGRKSTEAGVRLLAEKGVDPSHPAVAGALAALELNPERLERGIGRVGQAADDRGLGGALMIRATVFAYAGVEDRPLVREQVAVALDGFRTVLSARSMSDIATGYRGHLVFRPGVRWPSTYHLRLLALTGGWRSAENRQLVTEAVQRLVDLSPLPDIHFRIGSQLCAPASFVMRDFNPNLATLDGLGWMMWFHRLELLARLGVVSGVPQLTRQLESLRGMLTEGGGWFSRPLAHFSFRKWGAYTGLALEPDWRSPSRRIRDLTFRSLLILRYSAGWEPAVT